MSAALQSLMRDAPRLEGQGAPSFRGAAAFVVIGLVGALSFVVLSTAILRLETSIAPWIVNTACYGALIGPIYLLQRHYSFRSEAPHRQALPRYLAVQMMALALAGLFSFVIYGLGLPPSVFASLLVIGLTSGVNYLALRGWAFARTELVAAAA